MRRFLPWLLAALPAPLVGQASPYVPLDDPHLPVFELLVTRGDVRDPSPMVRPFRVTDALAALQHADTSNAPSRRLIQELRAAWVQDTAAAFWSLGARVGVDGYTDGRRDPLHPDGNDGVAFYGELRGEGRFGPVVGVSRPAVEPRVNDDPDWRGRTDLTIVGRMAEAYLSGQWKYARIFYGALDRQWGPSALPGIPLSPYAYPRTETAIEIGVDRLNLVSHASELADQTDSLGQRVHRYWFGHRLSARPSDRLALALWEVTVVGGVDRNFDARWRNPLSVLLLSNQYGLGHDGNIMVGADVTWWPSRTLRLEGQVAIDDINYPEPEGEDQTPSRYAFTFAASGPLGRRASWKALYSQVSSLALRTASPWETYADQDVGLGRGFPSNDQLSLLVTRPISGSWLVTPELTYFRQGDATLADPWPGADAAAGNVPVLLIGTPERTARAALGITGAHGAVRGAANVGVHYVDDADHVEGRTRTDVVARIRLTIGLATGGRLQ